jgi:hypothetical protein
MSVEYRFRFSEDHLLTSILRYRQQVWWRRPFYGLKWVLAVLLGVLVAICVANGLPIPAGIFGGFLGILLIGWPIDSWIARRRFRKSPYHNDELTFYLSKDGVHIVGRDHEVRIGWSTYTKARRFKDGLLLFQGPQMFNWLPDTAAVDPTGVAMANDLVHSHIGDYRDV